MGSPVFGRILKVNETLAEAVWIVVGVDSKGFEHQGTAFNLYGVGIVTARDVLEQAIGVGPCRGELRDAADPHKRYPITGYRAHSHPLLDMAVLESSAP